MFRDGTERAARELYRATGYPAHEVADPAPAKADTGDRVRPTAGADSPAGGLP